MVKNRIKTIIFLVLTAFSAMPTIEAGAGKSFGLFGGGLAAGIIGTKIFSGRNRNDRQQTVVQERVVERPVYVQQPPQQQVVATSAYETQLRQENMNLRRELFREHKAAEKRAKKRGDIRPTTAEELSKDIFDGFDPQLEG